MMRCQPGTANRKGPTVLFVVSNNSQFVKSEKKITFRGDWLNCRMNVIYFESTGQPERH